MADPGSALRDVADEHPALSAIGAGTLRRDDGRHGTAGAEQINAPAQLDNCRARSAAILEGARDSGTNLQCSPGTLEIRNESYIPPQIPRSLSAPGKQSSANMLAARKRALDLYHIK